MFSHGRGDSDAFCGDEGDGVDGNDWLVARGGRWEINHDEGDLER